MKGFVKRLIKLIRGETGQALILTLILLVVGGLTITPLLGLISTGLLTGQVYESKMHELYAADAGVEDGLWQIKNDQMSILFPNPPAPPDGYDEYAYSDYDASYKWEYDLAGGVNNKTVHVTIENVWMPEGISAPNYTKAREIAEGMPGNPPELIIAGNPPLAGGSQYEIKISYQGCGNPSVNMIGIWLPPDFEYVVGSSNLEEDSEKSYYCEPNIDPYKGGYAVVWDFASPVVIADFPNGIKFDFTPEGQSPDNAVSWINYSTGTGDDDITAWDADVKVYKITSTATNLDTMTNTTVESYTSKNEVRKLGSAISGDYFATGNSLIGFTNNDTYRDRLYRDSEATIETDEYGISGIPSDAKIETAFLYWAGWIDFHYRYWSNSSWIWGEVDALMYPDNPTSENLTTLVEQEAKVNNVSFSIGDDVREVTAAKWQVAPVTGDPSLIGTWSYCCFAEVTTLVNEAIQIGEIPPNGAATYTLSHSSNVINQHRSETSYYYYDFCDFPGGTGYPLGSPALMAGSESDLRDQSAYAGWSLVVIYSSPETKGHQLYLYDIDNPNFTFIEAWGPSGIENPDFDSDGNPGGTISGFLVPQPVEGEVNAAKITCFVGEGDSTIAGDHMKVNGESLPDGTGADTNNVWNSDSVGLTVPGVDIDTFYVTWNSGILESGDTSAQVDLTTGNDGFTLIYIILSFRSAITSGGVMGYLIK